MSNDRFDLVIIGGGGAAREAARLAISEHGARVAVIERGDWGGECERVACKPTKQYVAASELLNDIRAVGTDLGIETGTVGFDLGKLKDRKDWLIGTPDKWRARFEIDGLTALDGDATIVSATEVEVGGRVVDGDRILIATGSRTAVPPIEGIDAIEWIDNVGALELRTVPESLLIVGAGAVGLEFGQVFARFGSDVTVVEAADTIAGRSDHEAAASLRSALEADGIEILTGTFVSKVERIRNEIEATLAERGGDARSVVHATTLMLAAGRVPNTEGLGLDELGLKASRQGIVVDEYQRTSVSGIWAAGDVVAGIQLTPIAAYQGQVAVADMFGGSIRTADYSAVPSAIFTDPEIAGVGLTEEEARAAGFDVGTSVYPSRNLLRPSYTLPRDAESFGIVKLVFERGSRRLLGLHAVVRGGAEFVQGFATAIRLGATVDDIAFGHYAFPTAAEAVHYAAEAAIAGELVGA